MSYIRTKDGRVAEVKDNMIVRQCDDATRLVYKDRPFVCVLRGNDDIEKEAENLEELKDEFVFECPNGSRFTQKKLFSYCDDYLERGVRIYASIWVGKNLIAFAEMQKDGSWELL